MASTHDEISSNSSRVLLCQAANLANSVFDAGVELHSIKLVVQRMQKHAVQRSRPKINLGLLTKMKMLGSSMKKKVRPVRGW
jgi:hypothetical protein